MLRPWFYIRVFCLDIEFITFVTSSEKWRFPLFFDRQWWNIDVFSNNFLFEIFFAEYTRVCSRDSVWRLIMCYRISATFDFDKLITSLSSLTSCWRKIVLRGSISFKKILLSREFEVHWFHLLLIIRGFICIWKEFTEGLSIWNSSL